MNDLLRRYRAERFPWAMSLAVTLLLATAAQAGGGGGSASAGVDAVLAFLLFAQFRVLDDLADRSRDADVHPERSLVRATSVRPIVGAGLLLAAGTVGILLLRAGATGSTLGGPALSGALLVYLAVLLFFSVWYVLRGDRTLIGDHFLLTKYPAVVWIIASSRTGLPAASPASGRLLLSMMATYLTACIYEALHDRRSPARARPVLLAGEGLLLAVALLALSIRGAA